MGCSLKMDNSSWYQPHRWCGGYRAHLVGGRWRVREPRSGQIKDFIFYFYLLNRRYIKEKEQRLVSG